MRRREAVGHVRKILTVSERRACRVLGQVRRTQHATRSKCLTIEVAQKQSSRDVLRTLAGLMLKHGIPEYIRSDNGPEFVAKAVWDWLSRLEVGTFFIEPGSPWKNGYVESFNGKIKDGLLDGEIFTTLQEAKVLTEVWRREYNQVRPHSSLGYKPPAPETVSGPLSATAS